MKRFWIILVGVIVLSSISMPVHSEKDKTVDWHARGLVILALELPNKLGVGGREFKTKPNPKGEGVFVYDPRTRFHGVERNLIWIVINFDEVYPLNGPSKMLTPSLKWPREADPEVWKTTGLDPSPATYAIEIIFGSK